MEHRVVGRPSHLEIGREILAIREELQVTSRRLLVVSGMWCYLCVGIAAGQDWAQFRGPNGQGISTAKSIPVTWTDQDYNWRIKLPGPGHSSPVLWANQVFVTCADPQAPAGIVLALDVRTGKELWRQIGVEAGWKVTPCNDVSEARGARVDFDYYVQEVEKLVNGLS